MTKYLCLDISLTSTGCAVISLRSDGKWDVLDVRTLKSGNPRSYSDPICRKYSIVESLSSVLDTVEVYKDISFVVIEGYAFLANGRITDLAELTGLIKEELVINRGLQLCIIPPASVKKMVTGKGNAKKEVVRERVYDYIHNQSVSFKNNDESDAVAVGIAYGLLMLSSLEK